MKRPKPPFRGSSGRPGRAESSTPSPRGRQAYRGGAEARGAAALAELRERTGRTYSAIIEGLLLAAATINGLTADSRRGEEREMTDMNTEYETIAKARTYLGTIISAPTGRFVEMDVALLHQAHDELLRALRAMDKKSSISRAG